MDLFEKGKFERIVQGKDQLMEEKVLVKHFVNYFSFGVDGQIGYDFDKNRTSTRLGNLAVYGAATIAAGTKLLKNLGELVDIMKNGNEVVFKGDSKGFMDFIGSPFNFKLGDLVEGVKSMNTFHKNQNLLALNINSYMAGASDIWRKAK